MTGRAVTSTVTGRRSGGDAALVVRNLDVRFARAGGGAVRAVSDLSVTLRRGRLLVLVGESGCGKSVLTEALTGLLPATASTRGRAVLDPEGTDGGSIDLLGADERVLRTRVRGRRIGLVGQSAGSFLTPTRTLGAQLRETVHHLGGRHDAADLAARAHLPAGALDLYPHELSGGTAQRAGLAAALAGDPAVLLADEPTAGLDRPLVDRTMDLLAELAHDDGGRAVLVVTHDLRAARRVADDVAVMYASRLVETGPAAAVLSDPWHPYTAGLIGALPDRGFTPIPGHAPELSDLPPGCPFAPRCPVAAGSGSGAGTCTGDPTLRVVPRPSALPHGAAAGDRAVACHVPVGAP